MIRQAIPEGCRGTVRSRQPSSVMGRSALMWLQRWQADTTLVHFVPAATAARDDVVDRGSGRAAVGTPAAVAREERAPGQRHVAVVGHRTKRSNRTTAGAARAVVAECRTVAEGSSATALRASTSSTARRCVTTQSGSYVALSTSACTIECLLRTPGTWLAPGTLASVTR
jgi:hypothetical protein